MPLVGKKVQGNIMLLITAIIWGSAFVAQRTGMQYIGPFTFNGIRSFIGALVLIPVILIFSKISKNKDEQLSEKVRENLNQQKGELRTLIIGGICCGTILFISSSLQQIGLQYTSAGKAGFITALYIVLVPIAGRLVHKKVRPILWFCVIIALIGLYLLTIKEGFKIEKGDFVIFLCALGFTAHIMVIDHFSPKVNGVKLSCIQFFVCGVLSVPAMLLTETVDLQAVLDCWVPICYAGILSCGVAYTLQIIAQKHTDPTIASLLMSLESVFALIAGWIVLGEQLSPKELIGCLIMFIAIIISQLPEKKKE